MKEILQMKNKNDGGKWNYELYWIIFSKKKKKNYYCERPVRG
jgi:hypothetical protein